MTVVILNLIYLIVVLWMSRSISVKIIIVELILNNDKSVLSRKRGVHIQVLMSWRTAVDQ